MARFGSLGTQYFDDSGEVLSAGYIQFYLSGTSTPMDTYADINQTIENEWPVPLDASGYQPNIFFEGSAKAVLRDSAGVMVAYADPVGETEGGVAFQQWIASYRYGLGAVVQGSNYKFYQSKVASNLGNDPVDSPTQWELFGDVLIRENTINRAKGSLLVGNGTEVVEFPPGTNGYVLSYDDAEPGGLKAIPPPNPPPAGVVLLATYTPSGVAAADVEFTGSYGQYILVIENAIPVTDAVDANITVSNDGGGTFTAAISSQVTRAFSTTLATATAASLTVATSNTGVGNLSSEGFTSAIEFYAPLSPSQKSRAFFRTCLSDNAGVIVTREGAFQSPTTTVESWTDVRLAFSSGNIASATIRLYGVSTS